jgi:hypothetical protein
MRLPKVLWTILVALGLDLLTSPCVAAEYELFSVPYQEVSVEGSLPFLKDPTKKLTALESLTQGASVLPKPGDQAGATPDASSVLRVFTNDSSRFRTEAPEIFRALAFVPDTDGDVLTASFFDDLLFLYGGPVPVLVMKKESGAPSYVYLSHAPVGEGRVLRGSIGGRSVYWFQEDTDRVVSKLRVPEPRAPILVLWDSDGNQRMFTRYNRLEWHVDSLKIIGDTCALKARCSLDSSAVRCYERHAVCQLSLLDPVRWRPTVLRTTMEVGYLGGRLEIRGVLLTLEYAPDRVAKCLSCEPFRTIDEIRGHCRFGVCGANLNGVSSWRCLGDFESYLQESRERSSQYWQELLRRIDARVWGSIVSTDPSLNRAFDSVRQNLGSQDGAYAMPEGLGGVDAISMIEDFLEQ